METLKLSLDLVNTSEFHNLLDVELWMDKNKFFDNSISPGRHHIIHEFDVSDGEHYFKIVLKNKNKERSNKHTKIDNQGSIISDSMIAVSNVIVNDIEIDNLLVEKAQYVHDSNGIETIAVHPFYGNLGCNGHVQLKFSTPIYLWLLENM